MARGRRDAGLPAHAFWFGEDQARYVVTVRAADAQNVIEPRRRRPAFRSLGSVIPAATPLTLSGDRPILLSLCTERHEAWFPDYMAGANA